ncbi:MAG: hypothetical protein JO319_00900, partial [Acidobacteriaceae bacterium]|nr:hypothetical protein [Acidobacteriaceae bacterium]
PPPPTLTGITPAAGTHGTTVPVTLTGTNFTAAGTTISVSGGGVTPTIVSISADGTTISANFAISGGAARNARTVTVKNPGGASGGATGGATFTVN